MKSPWKRDDIKLDIKVEFSRLSFQKLKVSKVLFRAI